MWKPLVTCSAGHVGESTLWPTAHHRSHSVRPAEATPGSVRKDTRVTRHSGRKGTSRGRGWCLLSESGFPLHPDTLPSISHSCPSPPRVSKAPAACRRSASMEFHLTTTLSTLFSGPGVGAGTEAARSGRSADPPGPGARQVAWFGAAKDTRAGSPGNPTGSVGRPTGLGDTRPAWPSIQPDKRTETRGAGRGGRQTTARPGRDLAIQRKGRLLARAGDSQASSIALPS